MPHDYTSLKNNWQRHAAAQINDYVTGQTSFVAHVLPEDFLQLPTRGIWYALERKFGETAVRRALLPSHTVASPVAAEGDGIWLRRTNMVGINVRTIGSFWHVVKYAMTLPDAQNSIHLLPIWEPGVVASLYGIASWNINTEFFSPELAAVLPHLDSVEKQLKVTVNLLHLMGKTVGMDVIPHTDRYAEIVLTNPAYFEWLQRRDLTIVNHSARLYEAVQYRIVDWIRDEGPAVAWQDVPLDPALFFGERMPETERTRILFGEKADLWGRNARRNRLIQVLYEEGLEPVPATMAPPYRGLTVDPDETAKTIDDDGRVWRDYVLTRPEAMSRVFGPLTRFFLYEAIDDNRNWEIDFARPRPEVWQYAARHYADVAFTYNFDFMRGDMSHVQMRPEGVPEQTDDFYDIHRYIKAHVRRSRPWFGYFAESFLTPPNYMAFGDEPDHLEASGADSTLGDLQSRTIGTLGFLHDFRRYRDLIETRSFAPNFTVITADKDDPRFDEFYLSGNEIRLFLALFLTDMPSYMALGFETRDPHPVPAPNEFYTKLYVFQLSTGKNATRGPYQWGRNGTLFHRLTRLRQFADSLLPQLNGQKIHWLLPPSLRAGEQTSPSQVIAWTQVAWTHVFIANLNLEEPTQLSGPGLGKTDNWKVIFSTHQDSIAQMNSLSDLLPGEGRVYRIEQEKPGS
ncbi:MAG: hypothetical protein LH606_16055 [Cytophagaceae bacterium]|nr:hypothetical protein [Cytophagaceae bacterium]